jgi:hypothetical protein
VSFYFCSFQKLKKLLGRASLDLCETKNCAQSGVGRWGDHRDYKSIIYCHVGVSQIMLPCWDFTNYVAMFWISQILFSVTKRKGKDVPV